MNAPGARSKNDRAWGEARVITIAHRTHGGRRFAGMTIGVLGFLACVLADGSSGRAAEAVFASPEKALDALRSAINSGTKDELLALFGPEHEADLIGGDPAGVRFTVRQLRTNAALGLSLVPAGPDRLNVIVGNRGWPMPIPLVKAAQGWSFDVDAGLVEITNRRIGYNELSAIALCRVYLEAQARYAAADHDGDQVLEYAQKLTSTPGTKDGLFWQPGPDGEISPLGPLAASAEQYLGERREGEPLRGYYFRILAGQGANVPGGKYEYVINGNMIAGYALLAWPADYGRSGIMSFACSHHGKVFEKDLGRDTGNLAPAITAYDPDQTWAEASE